MMKSRLSWLLLIALLIPPLTASATTTGYRGSCEISFYVQKTIMKDFTGTAACEPFEISVTDNMIRVPDIAVQVTTMDTDNSKRDTDMHNMFEHETFPHIIGVTEVFSSDSLSTPEGHLVEMPEELTFALTIRDVTQPITARVTEPHIDASAIEATLVFDLSLASFELDPPSFMRIVRVKDTVEVRATMSLDRNPAATRMPPAQE